MSDRRRYDAVVVGAGPNGLAAAITLARAGRSVLVLEANQTVGGGARSAALTIPGFVHDVCSAVLPLGRASPVFAQWPLAEYGLQWVEPPISLAHPFDDEPALLIRREIDTTAAAMGDDGETYRRLVGPVARDWPVIAEALLGPIRPARVLRHPWRLGRFGLRAIQPATLLASRFHDPRVRALFGGVAAHSFMPADRLGTGAFALSLLGSGHAVGWPFARGGAQALSDALAAYLRALGGKIETGSRVGSYSDLPPHRAALFDVAPADLLRICGRRLRGTYRAQLRRYRHGPGVFKVDLALDGPVPWSDPSLAEAGTIHLGATLPEILAAGHAVAAGRSAERPFVLVAQPSRFDPGRAPEGKEVLWAYCHVPNGSTADMTDPILSQLERFAPGIRRRIIGRSSMGPAAMQSYNANYIGGDINGGLAHLPQLLTRPALRLDPYATPDPAIFICSASTPPGGGVHGLCGYHAARSALRGSLR